jgi:hypothetical protein
MTTPKPSSEWSAEDIAAAPRGTSFWEHVKCRCGWSRSVQLNSKPASIRKGFREMGEHFAGHREASRAMTTPEATPILDGSYAIDRNGDVWSIGSNWRGYGPRRITPIVDRSGYLRVRLTVDGSRRGFGVHRLACTTFHGPKPTPAHQVRHLNGDKTDNRSDNLAWGTAKDNAADRDGHGTTAWGSRNGFARLTPASVRYIRDQFANGRMLKALAEELGIDASTAGLVVNRKTWRHVR